MNSTILVIIKPLRSDSHNEIAPLSAKKDTQKITAFCAHDHRRDKRYAVPVKTPPAFNS